MLKKGSKTWLIVAVAGANVSLKRPFTASSSKNHSFAWRWLISPGKLTWGGGHYHDVFDLYDQELAAHVDTLLALFKRHYLTAFDKHDFVPLFSSIINYLTTNQELQALMHEAYNQSRALAEITHAFHTTVTLSEVADFGGQNDLATQLEINYNLAGVLTILTDWQKGNINASVTELTTSLAAIARHHWQ